jgi:proline-specific peptidase
LKRGKGEPLVMVQGLGQNLDGWTLQLNFFKKKMKVITLDNRGVGKSSRPNYEYTMDMFVEDINNLLNHLDINEKIHLMGASMGGMIAQNFVLKYPNKVKTLILCCTSAYWSANQLIEEWKQRENMDLDEAFEMELNGLFSKKYILEIKKNKVFYENLKETVMLNNPPSFQDFTNQASAANKTHDTRDQLPKINHPTLIISGTEDVIIDPSESEYLNEKIPNSELILLEGLGHGFFVEDADKANNITWDFIQKHLE